MPTVREVSDPYANFMLSPALATPPLCVTCFDFVTGDYARCYRCSRQPSLLGAVLPVSYSVGGGQLHHALRSYKDGPTTAVRDQFTRQLAAVLWRFLARHERCLNRRAGVERFDLVTTVPSSITARDDERPRLRALVGEQCGVTRERYERVLRPTDRGSEERRFEPDRYDAERRLDGRAVLLIDDTWTTGSRAQSAAAALREAGAERVALVVLGRHVNREYRDNEARLRAIPRPFDWDRCVFEAER